MLKSEELRASSAQNSIWNSRKIAFVYSKNDNDQYGRRIEPNGTWTVYHVFTGLPADHEGWPMVGLGRSTATALMTALNSGTAAGRLR